jgi:hypothetical protein
MKVLKLIALVAFLAGALCTPAFADFTGTTVDWQYYAYGGAYNGGGSPGSFVMPCGSCGSFFDYFEIESGPSSITFQYLSSGTWSDSPLSLPPTIYNGINLLFIGGPTITSVTIDSATNMVGFNSSYISFTGNDIEIDWHLLSFTPDTIVKLDLNSTTTPEPGSMILFGTGVLGVAGVIRRKLSL